MIKKQRLLIFFSLILLLITWNAHALLGMNFGNRLINQYHLSPKVYGLAMHAYNKARAKGMDDKQILTIIDYSIPSSKPRMWVLDLKHKSVKFYTHVTHGMKSGMDKAKYFSNQAGSKASSLGLFLTEDTYIGKNGYSLNLKGLDQGLNDNAHARRIVVHGAHYADESYIQYFGHLGRSWGCPAVSEKLSKPLIDTIKDGTLIFSYFPDKRLLSGSDYLS